jgi:hypothetical protein
MCHTSVATVQGNPTGAQSAFDRLSLLSAHSDGAMHTACSCLLATCCCACGHLKLAVQTSDSTTPYSTAPSLPPCTPSAPKNLQEKFSW